MIILIKLSENPQMQEDSAGDLFTVYLSEWSSNLQTEFMFKWHDGSTNWLGKYGQPIRLKLRKDGHLHLELWKRITVVTWLCC